MKTFYCYRNLQQFLTKTLKTRHYSEAVIKKKNPVVNKVLLSVYTGFVFISVNTVNLYDRTGKSIYGMPKHSILEMD